MGFEVKPDPNRLKEQVDRRCPRHGTRYVHSSGVDAETGIRWGMLECEQCELYECWDSETYLPGTKLYTNLFIQAAADSLDEGLVEDGV